LNGTAPPAPRRKPAQNAIAPLPGVTKAKPPAALPEAKQTKLDSVLAILGELTKQELKTVIAMACKLSMRE
jgi:hypothetical protein